MRRGGWQQRLIESNSYPRHKRSGLEPKKRTPAFTIMLAWALIVTFFTLAAYPPDVQAMLAPTEAEGAGGVPGLDRMEDLQRIQRFLEAKVVQQRLSDFGLTSEEIASRLSQLSDAQLHHVATEIDSLIPGGDGLGILIALLVIAILVVILIYLLGHKIVITKQ
jgi:hypothetical protein